MAEKRKLIFRKLARKTAVHLYQKDGNKKRVERVSDKGKDRILKRITKKMVSTLSGMSYKSHKGSNDRATVHFGTEGTEPKLGESESDSYSGSSRSDMTEDSSDSDRISEVDDEESEISELAELTMKTGMKPLAKKSERFLQMGLTNSVKKKAGKKDIFPLEDVNIPSLNSPRESNSSGSVISFVEPPVVSKLTLNERGKQSSIKSQGTRLK